MAVVAPASVATLSRRAVTVVVSTVQHESTAGERQRRGACAGTSRIAGVCCWCSELQLARPLLLTCTAGGRGCWTCSGREGLPVPAWSGGADPQCRKRVAEAAKAAAGEHARGQWGLPKCCARCSPELSGVARDRGEWALCSRHACAAAHRVRGRRPGGQRRCGERCSSSSAGVVTVGCGRGEHEHGHEREWWRRCGVAPRCRGVVAVVTRDDGKRHRWQRRRAGQDACGCRRASCCTTSRRAEVGAQFPTDARDAGVHHYPSRHYSAVIPLLCSLRCTAASICKAPCCVCASLCGAGHCCRRDSVGPQSRTDGGTATACVRAADGGHRRACRRRERVADAALHACGHGGWRRRPAKGRFGSTRIWC